MMNKRLFKNMVSLILLIIAVSTVAYSQIAVVVGKNSGRTADAGTIKNIFLGSKLTWPSGEKVVIADQSSTSVGEEFHKFLGKSVSAVRGIWAKLVLSGAAAPPVKCGDDSAVKRTVSSNNNAIGYISASSVDGSVKVLYKIE